MEGNVKQQSLLKILCIHGYRQNGRVFRERMGAFRKLTKKYAEFVFVSAPNLVPVSSTNLNPTSESACRDNYGERGWWFSRQDDYFNALDSTDCAKDFDKSVSMLKSVIHRDGPFDGIFGFSQGATMSALLCSILEIEADSAVKFSFAIFVAGFLSRSTVHSSLHQHGIRCPTLHIYGETDRVISKEMSEEFTSTCKNVTRITHEGGHFIPTAPPQKSVYLDFLDKILANKGKTLLT